MADEQRRTIPKLTKKQHDPTKIDKRRLVAALFHQELGIEAEKPAQPAREPIQESEEESPCLAPKNTTS